MTLMKSPFRSFDIFDPSLYMNKYWGTTNTTTKAFWYKQAATENAYELTFAVPGLTRDDINIDVDTANKYMTVSTQKKTPFNTAFNEKFDMLALSELYDVENPTATVNDGVLTIKFSKSTTQAVSTKKIEIQ